jgi:membrane-associated phospholipid phosphatase
VIRTTIAVLLFAITAQAGELRNAANDAKALATAPLHWNSHEWRRFGEGAALVGAVALADKPIQDFVQRHRSSTTDSFAKHITPFGGGRGLELAAVMFASGAVFHDRRLEGAGRDALISSLWAAGVVTPLLKRMGRARPFTNEGTYHFDPSQTKGGEHQSFPSGHATNAFALATAIAGHYDNWIVPTIAYTLATGVAASRVNDNVHWASDVVAGALIGRAVAKGVTFRHLTLGRKKYGVMFAVPLESLLPAARGEGTQ